MTLFGPDISKWQDGIAPAGLGFSFLIARASIGRTVDYLFDDALDFAYARRAPFAGYHFPYECSSHPADEQAATWDQACAGDTGIRCMIDWESDGSQAATVDDAVAVAQAIGDRGYRVTLLYTGKWYWEQMGSPDLRRLNELGVGLVIADYGPNHVGDAATIYAGRGGDTGRGWTPLGGVTPTLWQFGSQVRIGQVAGTGAPMYGDCNAFRGTVDDLARWFTVWDDAPDPTPTPDPGDDDMTAEQFDQLMTALATTNARLGSLVDDVNKIEPRVGKLVDLVGKIETRSDYVANDGLRRIVEDVDAIRDAVTTPD